MKKLFLFFFIFFNVSTRTMDKPILPERAFNYFRNRIGEFQKRNKKTLDRLSLAPIAFLGFDMVLRAFFLLRKPFNFSYYAIADFVFIVSAFCMLLPIKSKAGENRRDEIQPFRECVV